MLEPQEFVNNTRVEPAQKTYFYEREDKSIIAVNAKEAWELEEKRAKRLIFMKQYGVSDGKIVQQAVMDLREILKTKGLEAAQDYLREAHLKEQEAAKGHFEMPPNANVMGSGAQAARALGYM